METSEKDSTQTQKSATERERRIRITRLEENYKKVFRRIKEYSM